MSRSNRRFVLDNSSDNDLDQQLSRHGRSAAPSGTSARRHPSIPSAHDTADSINDSTASSRQPWLKRDESRETMQATTQRKMEKIAELRRRRHRDMSENLSENLSEEGIDKSPLLSMDSAAVLPPEESSSSLLRAPSNGQKRKSAAAEDARKELANSAGGEQFFNGGQLRTLLTRIDVEDITGEMDNLQLPPSQQQQQYSPPVSVKRQAVPQQSPRQSGVSRRATYQTNRNRRLSTLLSNEEVEDSKQSDEFCINIPRTSLGPMVVGYKRANTISSGIMRGLGQLRRRSKTVAQMLDGDSLDASGDDDMAERRMLRRKSDDDLDLQLAGHEAENQELRKELAGLHESVRALAKLAAANKFSAEAEEHRRELEQWLGSQ